MAFGDNYKIWKAVSSGALFPTIRMTEFPPAWRAANEEVICWLSPGTGVVGYDPVEVFNATPWKDTLTPIPLDEYRWRRLLQDNPDI